MAAVRKMSTLLVNGANNFLKLERTILPTIVACRHHLKPRLKEAVHCDYLDNKAYGIYALTTGYIKESAIEAGRIAIVRKAKTKEVNKIVAESPFTSKPVGSRMGKGKGKVNYWAGKAIAGQWLYEFNCESDELAREAFKHVSYKIPVRLRLRIRPKHKPTVLSAEELLGMYDRHFERNERLYLTD